MISVKLKFRVSSLIKNEGTLYFQFIYKRKVKQVSTPYHIYEWEWDKDSEDIINLTKVSLDRIEIIKSIRENVIWEKNRIKSCKKRSRLLQQKRRCCYSSDVAKLMFSS